MDTSKQCSADDTIEFNAYSVTVLEVPGIQGLSGPPGPIGPPGPKGDGADLTTIYTKEQVKALLGSYRSVWKSWVIPIGVPDGIRTAYVLPNNDTFFPETFKVYVNGLLESGFDILSDNSFSIHAPPLEVGDVLYCEYFSQRDYNQLLLNF